MFIDAMKLWTFMAQNELLSSVSFGDKVVGSKQGILKCHNFHVKNFIVLIRLIFDTAKLVMQFSNLRSL